MIKVILPTEIQLTVNDLRKSLWKEELFYLISDDLGINDLRKLWKEKFLPVSDQNSRQRF